ncbi:hypothetical protein ACOMHN_059859 [Nucella lapillus]
MSAPELPPIADRERHRPPSRSTSKSSLNQLTAAVTTKAYYTRLTSGTPLHRNHSDSSLKGLLLNSQGHTHSSGSVSSYPTAGGVGVGGGGGGDLGVIPPHLLHRSSSRAFSWCATDNSTGSIPKLETLFEKRNLADALQATPEGSNISRSNNNHNNNSSIIQTPPPPPPLLPPPPYQSLRNNNNNNNNIKTANNNIPPRSISVNGIRRSDSQELAKIKHRKKRLQSECGVGEMETFGTVEQFGRLRVNGMRRSMSDNKLVEKKNVRNARLNSFRHLSVTRTDRMASRRPSRIGGASTTLSMSKEGGMRRVSSVSAINNIVPPITTNNRTRIESNQDSENVDGGGGGGGGGGSEDSEEEEERRGRIQEWLLGLDFADVPPEPVIEYADDPPQTDTALHIVYQEGSS